MAESQEQGVDPKEKQQDEEALKVVSDEEYRTQVVEKYDLDADTDTDLIDKLVEGSKAEYKNLSTAIRQKIDWRTKAQTPEEKKEVEEKKEEIPPSAPETDVDKLVDKRFEERDLASLDLSDELKTEVKAYAQAKDITILAASESEYVGFLKTKEEEQEQEEDASASTRGGGATTKRDFSKLAEGDILNFSDEEQGEYNKWLREQE